jgi:hypothetical protein
LPKANSGPRKGIHRHWPAFADAWRGGYGPSMNGCVEASCLGPSKRSTPDDPR